MEKKIILFIILFNQDFKHLGCLLLVLSLIYNYKLNNKKIANYKEKKNNYKGIKKIRCNANFVLINFLKCKILKHKN